MAGGSAPMKAWPTEQSIKANYPSANNLAQHKGEEEKKEEAKVEEKKDEKKDAKEEVKEPETKE